MRKRKGKALFIAAIVAMAVFALAVIAGVIVFYAKATETNVIPLALIISGAFGVVLSMIVMFAVIPKGAQNGEDKDR